MPGWERGRSLKGRPSYWSWAVRPTVMFLVRWATQEEEQRFVGRKVEIFWTSRVWCSWGKDLWEQSHGQVATWIWRSGNTQVHWGVNGPGRQDPLFHLSLTTLAELACPIVQLKLLSIQGLEPDPSPVHLAKRPNLGIRMSGIYRWVGSWERSLDQPASEASKRS